MHTIEEVIEAIIMNSKTLHKEWIEGGSKERKHDKITTLLIFKRLIESIEKDVDIVKEEIKNRIYNSI